MPETKLVAIINVTPDSFSDGGQAFTADSALATIACFIAEGADVIDIGAESTRPGATPLSHKEEWARLAPVLAGLSPFSNIVFSVDTRHAETAQKALRYPIQWINDVSGFSSPQMIDAVRASGCKLVVMHSLGIPADKSIVLPEDTDVVSLLIDWARERFASLEAAGITRSRLIFDPGIGFGKTAAQSLAILEHMDRFGVLGVPLLIGHSRKSFLSLSKDASSAQRDAATLEVSKKLWGKVNYLRVHNITLHREALHVF